VILVRVRQDDAPDVRGPHARPPQPFAQRFVRLFRLRAGVDERDWVFRDQVDVDRADVEGRRERDGDDAHG
jgi:hypothetical protein